MHPTDTVSTKSFTKNNDIKQADAAIEMMLLEIEDLNIPRDLMARRFFEYGLEFAQPTNMRDKLQLTTWLSILEEQNRRIAQLQSQINDALNCNSTH